LSVNQLIASLSKAEKRYFKRYTQLNSSKTVPKYVKLFDVIDKNPEIEDVKLKSSGFNSADKNFLGNKVLECLSAFQTNLNPEQEVIQNLSYFPLLYEKGLLSEVFKRLNKSKKICERYDLIELHLLLLVWEKKLFKLNFIDINIEELADFEKMLLEQLNFKKHLSNIKENLNTIIFKDVRLTNPENRKAFDDLFGSNQLPRIDQLLSVESLLIYHHIKSVYYAFQKERGKSKEHSQKLVTLFEEYDAFRIKHTVWYKKSLCKHLEACFVTQDYEDLPKTIVKINQLNDNTPEMETEIFKTVSFHALLYNLQLGMFLQAEALVENIDKEWEKHQENIQDSRKMAIFYNCAILYFVREKWEDCLKWLQRIISFQRIVVRKDLQITARLLCVIASYEIDPTETDKAIQTAYKYLKRNDHYFKFEELFVSLFKALEKNDLKEKASLFDEFNRELNAFKSNEQLGFEEVQLWVKSKVEKKTIEDIYLKQLESS